MAGKKHATSTNDLRKILIDTIDSVRRGDISPSAANAVGNLSGKVIQSAKLDLEVMRLSAAGMDQAAAKLIDK